MRVALDLVEPGAERRKGSFDLFEIERLRRWLGNHVGRQDFLGRTMPRNSNVKWLQPAARRPRRTGYGSSIEAGKACVNGITH